jgi:hypothetical protein
MKKLREEIQFKESGGLFDLFDNQIKAAYNITDEEYDYIAEHMDEEELSIFVDGGGLGNDSEVVKFSTIRKALEIRNKYLKQYNESNK